MTNTHMDLYDRDFFAWMQQQAAAIRAGDWEAIDRENLGEEIDNIVRHALGELQQHLAKLLGCLLSWVYAPEGREAHPQWYVYALTRRLDIETISDVWPRLAQAVATTLPQAYAHGREVASKETGLPLATFPETCPWTLEQVLTATLHGPNSPFFGKPS